MQALFFFAISTRSLMKDNFYLRGTTMVRLCEYSPAYQAKIMNAVVFMFEEQHMDFNRIAFELNLKYWIVVEAYKQAKADELI